MSKIDKIFQGHLILDLGPLDVTPCRESTTTPLGGASAPLCRDASKHLRFYYSVASHIVASAI